MTTARLGRTPTTAAASYHHRPRIAQDNTLPACDSAGIRTAALSMNRPALRIASSSASDHKANGAIEPLDRNSRSPRLASRTRPPPAAGRRGRARRRATSGTADVTTPKST